MLASAGLAAGAKPIRDLGLLLNADRDKTIAALGRAASTRAASVKGAASP